ncbi:alcohol dehydrogenase [Vulcanimicrobium alpinum]|uniref:Alcohol dehydrogenase n=1 Tax=Vulcanimicrobium alpinum TaxID=3016050 RepID=A0AAN1XS16_UNVUL|nr:quinone oxidoreductase [Vulcanimicrobium alpinum]BDE04831.1 alcohol dehydrogenase [Vulcanimicrobium alpinum]
MKAIRIDRNGGPEVLEYVDVPVPAPGPGQVLVRHVVSGINYIDVYVRTGLYKGPLPTILGREGAGVVEAVGEGVTGFAKGTRVAYTQAGAGGYAEANVVEPQFLVEVPGDVDDRTACALMLQGFTAHYLTHDTFPLQPGNVALIHAAAGGVGQLLVQLAKVRGATVIATVGTAEKAAIAKAAGADHVVVYADEDFAEATRRLVGGHAVDVAYDSVGKDTWERSLSTLRPRGMLVVFGNASGPTPPVDPLKLAAAGSVYLTRPTLVDYTRTAEEVQQRARELFAYVEHGKLKASIGAAYPLADAAQAHRDLEARKTTGKLLLLP